MSKILDDVKTFLGLRNENEFDAEILGHIGSALSVLSQNSVGADLEDLNSETTWDEFKNEEQKDQNKKMFASIKLYVYLKTKILFDPPAPNAADTAKQVIDELFWRIREEYNDMSPEGVNDEEQDYINTEGHATTPFVDATAGGNMDTTEIEAQIDVPEVNINKL